MSIARNLSRRKETDEEQMNQTTINEKLNAYIFNVSPTVFSVDEAFYHDEKIEIPWENHGTWHKELIDSWKIDQEELAVLFQNRQNKQTLTTMSKGAAKLIQFVYWANNQPVDFTKWDSIDFKFAPVNFKERMNFIFVRPTLHHSFIQLGEMFVEFEKIYEKALALNKL